MLRPILTGSTVLGIALVTAFAGCSSSSTSAKGGTDSGAVTDATGNNHADSSSGAVDSGNTGDDSGDDSGGSCPDNAPFTPQPWEAPAPHQAVCSTTAIQAFLTACVDSTSQDPCTAWFDANVASDAGTGTACGNCISAPNNNGATWSDQYGYFYPNWGACIQVTDTTKGPACGQAYMAQTDCESFQCDDCADNAYETCAQTVDGAICKQYATATVSDCSSDLADGGVGQVCFPSETSGAQTQDADFTYIINLLCGGATSGDAGGADAPGDAPSGG